MKVDITEVIGCYERITTCTVVTGELVRHMLC